MHVSLEQHAELTQSQSSASLVQGGRASSKIQVQANGPAFAAPQSSFAPPLGGRQLPTASDTAKQNESQRRFPGQEAAAAAAAAEHKQAPQRSSRDSFVNDQPGRAQPINDVPQMVHEHVNAHTQPPLLLPESRASGSGTAGAAASVPMHLAPGPPQASAQRLARSEDVPRRATATMQPPQAAQRPSPSAQNLAERRRVPVAPSSTGAGAGTPATGAVGMHVSTAASSAAMQAPQAINLAAYAPASADLKRLVHVQNTLQHMHTALTKEQLEASQRLRELLSAEQVH